MAGFKLLLQKQLKGKQMQKEMSEFIQERRKIEEEHAKNLANLSQNSLTAQEEGYLSEVWAQVKKSLADEGEIHLKFPTKLQMEKAQRVLTECQRDLEIKIQQLEIKLSNKMEEDIKKAWSNSTQTGYDLMGCVELYSQAQSKWCEEMVTTILSWDNWKWRGWR
ncbi:Growth arrest-specific protein 7 [Sciurus carolinensis]|uniref:Growth arrest-specific protein 7 n=1 Tax=Sciurus carolinensis TaxID=30640 RepID=A0AA41NC86_SCICA|nr:Growth arrest-specific protein 7 [Sciurus carolinensis]